MSHPPESSKERSLSVADLQALGFESEKDPLAAANASIAQSYFFIRPAQNGVPALRLNIARHQLVEKKNLWRVSFSDGAKDLASSIIGGDGTRYRSADIEPEHILSTIQRFAAEIIAEHTAQDPRVTRIAEHATDARDSVHRCINCGQTADMEAKYCGLPNCDEIAATH